MSLHELTSAMSGFLSDEPLLTRIFLASAEMAVLAVGVYAVIRLGRLRSPRLVSLLWLLVLTKPLVALVIGATLPAFEVEVVQPGPVATVVPLVTGPGDSADAPSRVVRESTIPPAPRKEKSSWPWSTAQTMLIVWGLGVVVVGAKAFLDRVSLRQTISHAKQAPVAVMERYAQIAGHVHVRRRPTLLVTDAFESPVLARALRPVILLPAWLAKETGSCRLDWCLRHELTHWKLGDPIGNAIRQLAQVLFFFHPATWWASRKWEEATELACDRALVRDQHEVDEYAENLYQILAQIHGRRQRASMGGLFATRTQVGRRIAALLGNPLESAPRLGTLTAGCFVVLAIASLGVGGTFEKEVAKEPNAPQEESATARVVRFPDDASLGSLEIQETALISTWQMHWEDLAEAQGKIPVPAGSSLALYVSEEASADLSPLAGLGAGDLQLLSLTSDAITDADLIHIRGLTGLRVLILQGTRIDGSGLAHLTGMHNLEELRLGNHGLDLTNASMAHLSHLTSLRWLALWGTGIGDAGLAHLRPLKSLRFLALNNTMITNKGLEIVGKFTELERGLQVGQTRISDDGLAHLKGLTKLKHIKVYGNNITDAGLEHLRGLTSLENIWLGMNPITDEGLACLTGMKGLRELYADNTKITDAGLVHLGGFRSFWHLLISGIGDEGIGHLSGLPALAMVQIQSAEVTEASIPSFKKMAALNKLLLSGDFVDEELLTALRAALPDCDVSDPQLDSASRRNAVLRELRDKRRNSSPRRPRQGSGSSTPRYPHKNGSEQFRALYRLDDGEVLRRVAPPFLPERRLYWTGNTEAPDYLTFRWDNKVTSCSQCFQGRPTSVVDILRAVMLLDQGRFEGPQEVLDLEVPGDWIVHKNVGEAQLLGALEKILGEMGHPIRFQFREVERDVVVVSGKFRFDPLPDVQDERICIFAEYRDNSRIQTHGADVGDLLRKLADQTGFIVADETQATGVESLDIESAHKLSALRNRKVPIEKRTRLMNLVLANLSKQTSLQFALERRKVGVWFVVGD